MASHAREGHKAERREPDVIPDATPADAPPQSPLDFTLAVMRDPLKPDALRASLAKAALPYVHGRWCPLGSDPRDAQVGSTRLAPLNDAKAKLSPSVEAHEDSLIRHGRDEPGHDENKERAIVLEQRALAAEERMRETEQRALAAEARMRETEQRALAAEARVSDLEARGSVLDALLARVKAEWPDIFDATGAIRAPAASERDRLAQLVAAQERARDLEERAIAAEGALREAQFRARDMEQRACAAEELIAGRR